MKNGLLLLAIACLTVRFAFAQSIPTRSFMIGPIVGLNKTSYMNENEYAGLPSVKAPIGAFGGIDASYQLNRWLLGTKLLYQKQTYQATYPPFEYDPRSTPNPTIIYRTDTDYHLISIPLSVGYRLTAATRLQCFLGGTFELNYMAETGRQTVFFHDWHKYGYRQVHFRPGTRPRIWHPNNASVCNYPTSCSAIRTGSSV